MASSEYEDMINEITARAQAEMEKLGIPYTTQNRVAFLTGLKEAWAEDKDIRAVPWKLALTHEIVRLYNQLIEDAEIPD